MSLDEEWEQSGLVGKMAAGRYLIVSELAADARRTLYEAENVELGMRVTLGVVRADGTPTEQRLANGEKLRSLKQAGLVSVLDVGKLDSGELYVATERPEGKTLRSLAGGKPMEPRRALLVIRQVLEALAAAHAVGAIHGDVNPEHIVIMPGLGDERVKLTDFGVAVLAGATRAGNPVYCAPESAFGMVDGRADIYAIGAVLFELLTGHPPFFADDANALRRLHAYAPMQTLKQRVPDLAFADLLEPIVSTALAKNRDARYQTASDMIAALDPVLHVLEDAATPPARDTTTERRRKPNDSLLLLAKDLMPASDVSAPGALEPLVPLNTSREVPELPWPTRARETARRGFERARVVSISAVDRLGLKAKLETLSAKQRRLTAAGGAGLVLVLILAFVTCGGGRKPQPTSTARSEDGHAYVARARASLAAGNERDALADYESGLSALPALASDPQVIHGVSGLASSKDPESRHRALELAEEHGFSDEIDRVASWMLDLEQAMTCDERRAAIGKLAGAADKRALPALRKTRAHKCVERDAATAITRITKASKTH